MKKRVLFFGFALCVKLHGAAFSADVDTSRLEVVIAKAINAGDPIMGIVENLERLAALYDGGGDVFGQLEALRKISNLKGISKETKKANDARIGRILKELEAKLKAQAGQTTDMRLHYQAQVMLGRLYLLMSDSGDRERANAFLKPALAQKEYQDIASQALIVMGDLNRSLKTSDGVALAIEYYRLIPEDDLLWPLAQAKLGVLLMHQGAEKAKEALANGASALNDRSFSMQERTKAKMLAAEHLKFQQNWQEAAKYFVQVADEALSEKERLQANLQAAILLQRTQPLLAPIYFKRVYDEKLIKNIDSASQMFARMVAAKELASLELERERDQKTTDVLAYLQAALDGAQELVSLLLKNKKMLNNTPRVVRSFLNGMYGLNSVIHTAENKLGENKLVAKLRADFELLDQKLDDIEDKKGMEL